MKSIIKQKTAEIILPVGLMIVFFVLQSLGLIREFWLGSILVLIMCLTWWLKYYKGEALLFIIGLFSGAFIEIGLRVFGFQQVWKDSSLFGVPVWLPVVWGVGFVLIARLGDMVKKK